MTPRAEDHARVLVITAIFYHPFLPRFLFRSAERQRSLLTVLLCSQAQEMLRRQLDGGGRPQPSDLPRVPLTPHPIRPELHEQQPQHRISTLRDYETSFGKTPVIIRLLIPAVIIITNTLRNNAGV